MDILRSFFIDGFVPGDYTYGLVHILSVVIGISIIPISIHLFKGKDSDYIYDKLKYIAIFTLVLYFVRRGVDVYKGKAFLKVFWPFYICNVNTIFLSLGIIFKIKKGQDFFIITGMLGAVLMFVTPVGVFNDKYLTLTILDSVFSHYEIVILPLILLFTKAYKLDIKRSWQVILGLLILLFNVEILQPILVNEQVDYLFIRGHLPFTIDGVPQVIIMFLTMVFYVYLVYYIDLLMKREKILKPKKSW